MIPSDFLTRTNSPQLSKSHSTVNTYEREHEQDLQKLKQKLLKIVTLKKFEEKEFQEKIKKLEIEISKKDDKIGKLLEINENLCGEVRSGREEFHNYKQDLGQKFEETKSLFTEINRLTATSSSDAAAVLVIPEKQQTLETLNQSLKTTLNNIKQTLTKSSSLHLTTQLSNNATKTDLTNKIELLKNENTNLSKNLQKSEENIEFLKSQILNQNNQLSPEKILNI